MAVVPCTRRAGHAPHAICNRRLGLIAGRSTGPARSQNVANRDIAGLRPALQCLAPRSGPAEGSFGAPPLNENGRPLLLLAIQKPRPVSKASRKTTELNSARERGQPFQSALDQ